MFSGLYVCSYVYYCILLVGFCYWSFLSRAVSSIGPVYVFQ